MEYLLRLIPYVIVPPDEEVILLRGGKFKKKLRCGFYLKWPIYDTIYNIVITEQVANLDNQRVEDKSGRTWSIGGKVTYEVIDSYKALFDVHEVDDVVRSNTMSTIASYISRMENPRYDDICTEALDDLQISAERWGIDIWEIELTDYSTCIVLHLVQQEVTKENTL